MASARDLTLQLNGKWYRHYGVAPCPVCQPARQKHQTALTLRDSEIGLLAHCKKSNCDFRDIVSALGLRDAPFRPADPFEMALRKTQDHEQRRKRSAQAQAIWDEATPIQGTVSEAYLRSRGITAILPETLRHHSSCWHSPTAKTYPALIARVDGSDGFAIHRTYLKADGSGKADITPSKAMLGTTAGGAVRLSPLKQGIILAEGIETALSLASKLSDLPATFMAALSTSGMKGFCLPPDPSVLFIATDGDDAGKAAGYDLAAKAYMNGWTVRMMEAPPGQDWNDVLRSMGCKA